MEMPTNPKQRNLVTGLIVIGLIIVIFFGLRTIRAFREFRGHRPPPPFATEHIETDVSLIRDWMTIPLSQKCIVYRQAYSLKPWRFNPIEIEKKASGN